MVYVPYDPYSYGKPAQRTPHYRSAPKGATQHPASPLTPSGLYTGPQPYYEPYHYGHYMPPYDPYQSSYSAYAVISPGLLNKWNCSVNARIHALKQIQDMESHYRTINNRMHQLCRLLISKSVCLHVPIKDSVRLDLDESCCAGLQCWMGHSLLPLYPECSTPC